MTVLTEIRKDLLELEQTLRELNQDVTIKAYIHEEKIEKKLLEEIEKVTKLLKKQEKKQDEIIVEQLVRLYEIIRDAKKQRESKSFKDKLSEIAEKLELLLKPIRTTDIHEEMILDVEMGKYAILFPNSKERFLRTYGVTTCTVCALAFPRIHCIVLGHLAPNIGIRFTEFLIRVKEEVRTVDPDIEKERCLFYLKVHPHKTLLNPSEWLKSEERKSRTPKTIQKVFPNLAQMEVKQTKVIEGCAIDVIVDKNSGKVNIYNSSFVDAEFPKQRDF